MKFQTSELTTAEMQQLAKRNMGYFVDNNTWAMIERLLDGAVSQIAQTSIDGGTPAGKVLSSVLTRLRNVSAQLETVGFAHHATNQMIDVDTPPQATFDGWVRTETAPPATPEIDVTGMGLPAGVMTEITPPVVTVVNPTRLTLSGNMVEIPIERPDTPSDETLTQALQRQVESLLGDVDEMKLTPDKQLSFVAYGSITVAEMVTLAQVIGVENESITFTPLNNVAYPKNERYHVHADLS